MDIGNQLIETIGMYGKKEYKEWASEEQCYHPVEISKQLLDMVFNKQYGIFYYEPADEAEAIVMIDKFKEKIRELEAKYIGVENE